MKEIEGGEEIERGKERKIKLLKFKKLSFKSLISEFRKYFHLSCLKQN